MKLRSFSALAVSALMIVACFGSGCAAEPETGDEPSSAAGADEASAEDGEENVATTEAELTVSCDTACGSGSVVACARFGGMGAVACGFSSLYVCSQVCKDRAKPRYCAYKAGRRCAAHATWWDTNSRCLRWYC